MIRILVIDDEQSNLLLIETMLMDYELQLDTFDSPVKALTNLIKNPHYDLILIDKMMPEMDGSKFINRMRSISGLSDIPVIVQSASALPEQINLLLDLGAENYLVKPFSREQLVTAIENAINTKIQS